MNNKGQALVEFVLILPVFLFLLLTIYDFGMIFNAKNDLLNKSNDIVSMYNNNQSLEDITKIYKNIIVSVINTNDYNKIEIKSSVKITTPLIKKILGNPYQIKVERYLPNEQ